MTIQLLFNDKQAKKIWYDLAYGKGKISEGKSVKILNSDIGELSNFYPLVTKDITTLSTLLSDRRGMIDYDLLTTIIYDYLSNSKLSLGDVAILMSDEMLSYRWITNLISNENLPIEALIEDDYYAVNHLEGHGWDKKQVADIRVWNLNLRIKEVISYLETINPEVDLQSLPADFTLGLIDIKQG